MRLLVLDESKDNAATEEDELNYKRLINRISSRAKRNRYWGLIRNKGWSRDGFHTSSALAYKSSRVFDGTQMQYYQLNIFVNRPSFFSYEGPYVTISTRWKDRYFESDFLDHKGENQLKLAEEKLVRKLGSLTFRYEDVDTAFLKKLFKAVDDISREADSKLLAAKDKHSSVYKYGLKVLPGKAFPYGNNGLRQYFPDVDNGVGLKIDSFVDQNRTEISVDSFSRLDFYNDDLLKEISRAVSDGRVYLGSLYMSHLITKKDMDTVAKVLSNRYEEFTNK